MPDRPWDGRELHFIGAGGAGMSGLALIADELGAIVSGSDRSTSTYSERLARRGISVVAGHAADQVPAGAEVVVSTAISTENPELEIARERGQTVIHRGELLAEVCALRRVIAVAGTHGKTTTTGMIAHALRASGEPAGFAIGGELPGAGPNGEPANAAWGPSEWFVAEADESDASFLRLSPEIAVVTNVELDHHARWSSRGELIRAFAEFAGPARAAVVADDPSLGAVGAEAEERRTFDPVGARTEIELSVPGRHNAANATAALAAIELAGGDAAKARAALAGFPGMLRRMEAKGAAHSGARVYDDYAHHPTEVRAAIGAARELGGERLVVVFQPHLYSRTKELAHGFGEALAGADLVCVLDVYAAREEPTGELAGVSGIDVAAAAADAGARVWWLASIEAATGRLGSALRSGDVLVTIGAGDVHRVGEALVAKPGADAQGRAL